MSEIEREYSDEKERVKNKERFRNYVSRINNTDKGIKIKEDEGCKSIKKIFDSCLTRCKQDKPYTDNKEEALRQGRGSKYKTVFLYEDGDFTCSSSAAKKYIFSQVKLEKTTDLISLYSADSTIHMHAGDSADAILNLIYYTILNEDEITFIDPYAAENQRNALIFMDYYLDKVKTGADVILYVQKGKIAPEYADKILDYRSDIKLTIIAVDTHENHGRYILTRGRIINIGSGQTFFKRNDDNKCYITENDDFNYYISDDAEFDNAIKYAGKEIGKYKDGFLKLKEGGIETCIVEDHRYAN